MSWSASRKETPYRAPGTPARSRKGDPTSGENPPGPDPRSSMFSAPPSAASSRSKKPSRS